jgi:rsbT co-antagonist protein RsbR
MTTKDELQARIAELEAEQARMAVIYQISRDLNTARNEDELLQALARPALEAGVSGASLVYIDLDEAGEPEWITTVAYWHRADAPSTPVGTRFYLPDFSMTRLWTASPDEPLLVADATTDGRVDENARNALAQVNGRALAVIPLTQAGRWVGLIALTWAEPHEFSNQEAEIYRALTGLATPAVENRRLVDSLEQMASRRTGEVAIFRTLVENSVDGISMSDPEGKITYANRAGHQLYGYDYEKQEMVGFYFSDLLVEEAKTLLEEAIPQTLQGGWSGEIKQRRRDGSLFDTHVTTFPLHDETGNIISMAAVIRDITERKRAEKQLRRQQEQTERSERLLRSVIDATPDWIFAKGRDFRYILINKSFTEAIGTTPEEAVGKDDLEIGFPEELVFGNPAKGIRGFRTDDRAVIESGEALHNPYDPATSADGSVHIFDTKKMPLRDAEGNIFAVLGVARDISERVQAEEERERLQQQIIDAQKRAIQELSTPIIPIMDRIIVMPLIGSIDTLRARDITRTLLGGISQYRAKVVILDITGVPIVDSGVAAHLNKTIQAARLKGAHTIVTGVSDAVAETIVDLGIDWSGVETLRDLQTGLTAALSSMSMGIVMRKT